MRLLGICEVLALFSCMVSAATQLSITNEIMVMYESDRRLNDEVFRSILGEGWKRGGRGAEEGWSRVRRPITTGIENSEFVRVSTTHTCDELMKTIMQLENHPDLAGLNLT